MRMLKSKNSFLKNPLKLSLLIGLICFCVNETNSRPIENLESGSKVTIESIIEKVVKSQESNRLKVFSKRPEFIKRIGDKDIKKSSSEVVGFNEEMIDINKDSIFLDYYDEEETSISEETTTDIEEIDDDKNYDEIIEEEEIEFTFEKDLKSAFNGELPGNDEEDEDIKKEDIEKIISREYLDASDSASYFRSELSKYEKKIYDSIYSVFNKSSISTLQITIKNLESYKVSKSSNSKATVRAIGALVRDHPEIWWITSYSSTMYLSNNYISKLIINMDANYSVSSINKRSQLIRDKANEIISKAKKFGSTKDRMKYIHDYLVTEIQYDKKASNSDNIYGALIKNKVRCEGYAEAFAYLVRLINVPAISVCSSTHKWNYVNLGGNWYVVDVTFDDPSVNGVYYESGNDDNLSHDFFLIGKNTIVRNNQTYAKYSDRTLVSYVEYSNASGFTYPTLSKNAY